MVSMRQARARGAAPLAARQAASGRAYLSNSRRIRKSMDTQTTEQRLLYYPGQKTWNFGWTLGVSPCFIWSEWPDSNRRPLDPPVKCATGLRYTPDRAKPYIFRGCGASAKTGGENLTEPKRSQTQPGGTSFQRKVPRVRGWFAAISCADQGKRTGTPYLRRKAFMAGRGISAT